MPMTPSSAKPYLLRALYDWCVDSGFTPHVVVRVDGATRVPQAYVSEGQIVLNIAPYATQGLHISATDITCEARFGGVAQALFVPLANVLAIYARENGQGMAFELDAVDDDFAEDQAESASVPGLHVISAEPVAGEVPASDDVPDEDPPPASPPARTHLRVVK